MPFRLSRLSCAASGAAAFVFLCRSLPRLAQNSDKGVEKDAEHAWSKDYNLTGSPSLTI